eukprot:scaffold1350_cov56-Cyclotella_meneghiniana.AAC.30
MIGHIGTVKNPVPPDQLEDLNLCSKHVQAPHSNVAIASLYTAPCTTQLNTGLLLISSFSLH